MTVHKLEDRQRLFSFLQENMGFFTGAGNCSVAAFLYSAILTRNRYSGRTVVEII
jgi:hypothetical protein